MNPLPTGPYKIILADPPWSFRCWSKRGEGRSASQHYDLMTDADILDLPVNRISAQDSILFLWVTSPLLELGLKTIDAWGFKYKTVAFTWIKTTKSGKPFTGMGYYTRANAEYVLLGVKGKPLNRMDKSVSSVVISPRMEHSRKPNEAMERMVQLFGDVPRIELFARRRTEGWDAWGNEVSNAL